MSKKHPKLGIKADQLLPLAEADFRVGNFYEARKLSRHIMGLQDGSLAQVKGAAEILAMTSVDPLVLGVGLLGLIFTTLVAFWAAY